MFAEFPSWLQDFANDRGKSKARAPQNDGTAAPTRTPWSAEAESRLRSALTAIPASEYDIWIRVGMALHHLQWVRSDGTSIGLDLWHEYSAQCPEKYSRAVLEQKWESFSRSNGPMVTVASIFHMARQYGWAEDDFHTDLGNARRLVKRHGANTRFVPEWHEWVIWSGNRWEIDNDGAVVRLAKEAVTAIYAEALKIADQSRRDALIKHALKSQAETRLKAMVSLAESESEVVLSAKLLDADPWLFGVQNGVVELKTGRFRAGRREDVVTKQAGVSYDPGARCPEWLKFLDTVTGGDKQLQAYLQRAIGYSFDWIGARRGDFRTVWNRQQRQIDFSRDSSLAVWRLCAGGRC